MGHRPFDAKEACTYQEAWAKHLGVEVRTDGPLDMKLILIPPGTFWIGTNQSEADELAKGDKKQKAYNRSGSTHFRRKRSSSCS